MGKVWIFSGTTHSPSFCKTLQVLWWRLAFTHSMSTTFKIDNKKLKNTMEGECDPTGNQENSGIIRFQHSMKPKYHQPWKKSSLQENKKFFYHSTPVSIHNEMRSSNFYLAKWIEAKHFKLFSNRICLHLSFLLCDSLYINGTTKLWWFYLRYSWPFRIVWTIWWRG